jgi:hypothetical protein
MKFTPFHSEGDVEGAAVQFEDKEWLREPFRTVRQAMAELDNLIGPSAGVFTYTGHVSIDELELELFG